MTFFNDNSIFMITDHSVEIEKVLVKFVFVVVGFECTRKHVFRRIFFLFNLLKGVLRLNTRIVVPLHIIYLKFQVLLLILLF